MHHVRQQVFGVPVLGPASDLIRDLQEPAFPSCSSPPEYSPMDPFPLSKERYHTKSRRRYKHQLLSGTAATMENGKKYYYPLNLLHLLPTSNVQTDTVIFLYQSVITNILLHSCQISDFFLYLPLLLSYRNKSFLFPHNLCY